jgi:hypothetical protein
MMVAEYAVDDSSDILFLIIDTDFDLISSGYHRVNKKRLRELCLEVELEDIDSFLEFSPIVTVESDG